MRLFKIIIAAIIALGGAAVTGAIYLQNETGAIGVGSLRLRVSASVHDGIPVGSVLSA